MARCRLAWLAQVITPQCVLLHMIIFMLAGELIIVSASIHSPLPPSHTHICTYTCTHTRTHTHTHTHTHPHKCGGTDSKSCEKETKNKFINCKLYSFWPQLYTAEDTSAWTICCCSLGNSAGTVYLVSDSLLCFFSYTQWGRHEREVQDGSQWLLTTTQEFSQYRSVIINWYNSLA